MQLAVRAPVSARPAIGGRVARPAARGARLVAFTAPKKEAIETAIKEAEEACEGGPSGECAAAWDTVEELSAAASHAKAKTGTSKDPLEDKRVNEYCEDNPAEPECRVYDE